MISLVSVKMKNQTLFLLEHLSNFEYLTKSNVSYTTTVDSSSLREALLIFQEYYNLTIGGNINNDLLVIIKLPRCSLQDDVFNF